MRRVGWQIQVRRDEVEEYKEAHRNLEEVFHLD